VAEQIKNIFISHVHKDDAGLTDLKTLIESKGMKIRDSSITSDKPNRATSRDYIKSKILGPRIDWAGCMIVYISPETKASEWVNWEIERAHWQDKPIIGVWESGARDCEIPEALDQYGHACVDWNPDKIIAAINGDCNDFEAQDGTPLPERSIKHHRCSKR